MAWISAGPRAERGFNLLELMIVLAVLAIGTTLAVPSFTQAMRTNHLAGGVNELIGAFNLARSEAVRNKRGAGVCPSETGNACGGTDWNVGTLAYADNDASGAWSVGDTVLRYVQPDPALVVTAIVGAGEPGAGSADTTSQVAYDRRGRVLVATEIEIRVEDCPEGQEFQRTILISRIGQVRTSRGNCT